MSTDDDDENDAGRQTSKSTRLLQVFFTGGRGGGRGRGEGRRRESSGNLEKGEKGGEGGEREKLATLIDARTAASLAIAQKKTFWQYVRVRQRHTAFPNFSCSSVADCTG